MNVLSLQVFVSLMLVLSAIVALLYSVKQADHEHSDRLSLLPLEEDEAAHAHAPPLTTPAPAGAGAPLPAVKQPSPNEGD